MNLFRVEPAMSKSEARAIAAAARVSRTIEDVQTCRLLAAFVAERVRADKRVVIYDAMRDEVNLAGLIAAQDRPAERLGVTRTPDDGHRLTLHSWGGPTEVHRYGYRQPAADALELDDEEVGAVLVPGLLFAIDGMRLGRGKGYYDRLLARLSPTCLRIGMTAGLIADRVPFDRYDVAMTHLATEAEVIEVIAR